MNIKKALKEKSVNGKIDENKAIPIAEQADLLIEELSEMLDRCKKQVGMYLGGEISMLQSKIKGFKFNEADYNHERLPDGQ